MRSLLIFVLQSVQADRFNFEQHTKVRGKEKAGVY
jgi:hypothetical protein